MVYLKDINNKDSVQLNAYAVHVFEVNAFRLLSTL